MIYQMAEAIQRRPVKLFDDGTQRRDYIFVDDVVRANLLAMECNETCVVNCGSGEATSFNRLYEMLRDLLNKHSWGNPIYIPNSYKGKYQYHTQCDMTLAAKKIGFRPKYDIESGIKEYHTRGGFRI
jgi:ADP-L-glycero-D-manno-heptose 6-epimerase